MLTADAIRACMDGAVPGVLATCDIEGQPNVTYLSQVEYIDAEHIALSFQFFNTTRRNILVNPRATLLLTHPQTAALYRLAVLYLRTETTGPLFEQMRAKLSGIASHTGMGGVFKLQGSDIYRVLAIESLPGNAPLPLPAYPLLAGLRRVSERLRDCADLDELLSATLTGLREQLRIEHAMILLRDESGRRLYTVASCGYERSGVGSEIAVGEGVIGVAAAQGTPIRIGYMTAEYGYGRAVRERALDSGLGALLENEIPLSGLPESRSQLAVPIAATTLLGVLYVESAEELRFDYDHEDALVTLANQLGLAMAALPRRAAAEIGSAEPVQTAAPLLLRHYADSDSIFLGDEYLIKGVAGAILWALVRDYCDQHRTEFSNRELRLDPRIRLPELSDNLEARLILLQRRLLERAAPLRIEKAGRGRFRLQVLCRLELQEIAG